MGIPDEDTSFNPPLQRCEVVPVTRQTLSGIMAHWSTLPHEEGMVPVCTLDLTVPANRITVQQCIAGESLSLWDLCSSEPFDFECHDLIAHYAEYESEEHPGELKQGPMLTLIGPCGVYHTGSEFAFRALQLVASLDGNPPWAPPQMLTAVRCQSRNRRAYQSIIWKGRSVV